MKAYWISPGSRGTAVELRETPEPQPKAGEILVRVRAASLNRGELLGGAPGAAPKPGGGECAGEVVKVGDGVTGVSVGARTMGRCGGGFAELALMDAREALRVPERLTWEEAAATPLTFIVVYDMLIAQGHLAAGQWLFVTGISSGVGVAALQTAKALGARVIGTSGSADKLARLEKIGLDVGLRTRASDFHDAVMKATEGKGVHLVVNNVGGSMFAECVWRSRGGWRRWAISTTCSRQPWTSRRCIASASRSSASATGCGRRRSAPRPCAPSRATCCLTSRMVGCGHSSTASSASTSCPGPSRSWNPTRRSARSSSASDDPAPSGIEPA